LKPQDWELDRVGGRLAMDGHDLAALAGEFGTPLHVVSAAKLQRRCREFTDAFRAYPRRTLACFSYKTNCVAGVLQQLHRAGMGAEVTGAYQLALALRLGVEPGDVVVGGPNKSDGELRQALEAGVGIVVVDSLDELARLEQAAGELGVRAPVALRICPDVAPRGLNASARSGSRRMHFGLDLKSGEADAALERAIRSTHVALRGLHAHIGSGIRDVRWFGTEVKRVLAVYARALRLGAGLDLIDLGGGLGTGGSREFTTLEQLVYLGLGRLPGRNRPAPPDLIARYGAAVTGAIAKACARLGIPLPDLVLEPGRAVVSDADVLLLSVGTTRDRPGVGRIAFADGGAMSVSLMFLSEVHEVFLANRDAPLEGKTSVFGRVPTGMDVVYRNLPLPRLRTGDVLAVMDAGAYFTSTATNFGGPRPAVVMIENGVARLIRRRETFDDLTRTEVALDEGR
jgi:diaminopimelate decarboxylase